VVDAGSGGAGVESASGLIDLDAGGTDSDLAVNHTIQVQNTSANNIELTAADSVAFAAAGAVSLNATGTGLVRVTANSDDAAGNGGNLIDMTDGALVDAGAGTIQLDTVGGGAGGNILLGGLTTTNTTNTTDVTAARYQAA